VNEDQKQDRKFMDTFMIILGGLMLFTFGLFVYANVLGTKHQENVNSQNTRMQAAQAERLAPVGGVPAEMVVNAEKEAEAARIKALQPVNAQSVYEGACAACHAAGILEAPKFADAASWAPRIEKGKETLYENALKGIGLMAAKGGRADLSDKEVIAAVDYMVDNSQ